MRRPTPSSTRTDPRFPDTTRFRSIWHCVDLQLRKLPEAEAADDQEKGEYRPTHADGERHEICDHGLFFLARALAEFGLEQKCVFGCDLAACRETDRKSTRLNSSNSCASRMPSSD